MGTWGPSPFDNDAAADFLGEAEASPARFVSKKLREIAKMPTGRSLDVDDGSAGWAACEIVALAFGYGDTSTLGDSVLDIVGKLRPKEDDRLLALKALPRLADRAMSELAALWHEGKDGAQFDASLTQLRERLESAKKGPRELPKPKTGDVIVLQAAPDSKEMIVVQVVGPGEVAVFEGTCGDERDALDSLKTRPARRIPASVNKILRRGRTIANVPPRKDLRGKKLYAGETGSIEEYVLATASAGGAQIVSYDEARDRDVLQPYDEEAIRRVALGKQPARRVRSPDEREAELRARNADRWTRRREATTPSPFGDIDQLERLLLWIEEYGIQNAVKRFHDEAVGASGYGRPMEEAERGSYAFAGLAALWHGTWASNKWPSALAGRLPPPPAANLMSQALTAARVLASRVLTRDAELKLIWDGAPDSGAGLREWVTSLESALR